VTEFLAGRRVYFPSVGMSRCSSPWLAVPHDWDQSFNSGRDATLQDAVCLFPSIAPREIFYPSFEGVHLLFYRQPFLLFPPLFLVWVSVSFCVPRSDFVALGRLYHSLPFPDAASPFKSVSQLNPSWTGLYLDFYFLVFLLPIFFFFSLQS